MREFRYDRGVLGLVCLGALAFVVLGSWLIWFSLGAPWQFQSWVDAAKSLLRLPVVAVSAVTILFFGAILIVAISAIFDRSPVISIGESSVHDRRWGGPAVPLHHVRSIQGIVIVEPDEVAPTGPVSILVDDVGLYYQPRGLFARVTYGTMRNPLYFNMAALDGTISELAEELAVVAPDKIARHPMTDDD